MPDPESLIKIFDTISYAKGSVICRMLADFIGDPQLFKKILSRYMHTFAYKNASTEDLLALCDSELEKVPKEQRGFSKESEHLSVSQFLMPWIN